MSYSYQPRNPELLTTKEVAGILKISKQSVCKMAQTERLKSVRIGNLLRFNRNDINEYLQGGGDIDRL
jgi:excisionase family DNA binding protein